MAELVLPLLVDKLSSTHVPAKMEALATLQLAPRYVYVRMCKDGSEGGRRDEGVLVVYDPANLHPRTPTLPPKQTAPTASPPYGATSLA